MARRTQPPPPSPAKLTTEEMRKGVALLLRRLAEVEAFDPGNPDEHEREALERSVDEALERVFGQDTSDYQRYSAAAQFDLGPVMMGGNIWGRSAPVDRTHYIEDGRKKSIALLKSAIKTLEERIADEDVSGSRAPSTHAAVSQAPNKKVFVVHGHDHGAKDAAARLIEKLGLEAIILSEQTNQGRTLIEKFEAHTDVGFAIVLLTPDDVGGTSPQSLQPRARQNVILELGYFVGKLSRSRVCALVGSRDLELPSDIHGIAWIYLDGAWQFHLARELRAAGYAIDMNRL